MCVKRLKDRWIEQAEADRLHPAVIGFVQQYPHAMFIGPASWDAVSDLLASGEPAGSPAICRLVGQMGCVFACFAKMEEKVFARSVRLGGVGILQIGDARIENGIALAYAARAIRDIADRGSRPVEVGQLFSYLMDRFAPEIWIKATRLGFCVHGFPDDRSQPGIVRVMDSCGDLIRASGWGED